MTSAELAEALRQLECRIRAEEQALLSTIYRLEGLHTGHPRSYELEDIRRELRKLVLTLIKPAI